MRSTDLAGVDAAAGVLVRLAAGPQVRVADVPKKRKPEGAPSRASGFTHGSRAVSKPTRRSASKPTQRTVKTSVILDVETHAKLAALAALRGVPMTTIMADAITSAVASMVVFDRSVKASKRGDSPGLVEESAPEAA